MLHKLAVIKERVDSRDYGCQGVSLGVAVPVDIDRCLFFCYCLRVVKGQLCWCDDTFRFLCIKDMTVADFSKVDSASRFLLDEAGVSAEAQKKVYDAGFDTLRSFLRAWTRHPPLCAQP